MHFILKRTFFKTEWSLNKVSQIDSQSSRSLRKRSKKTLKLGAICTPKLKKTVPLLQKNGCIYEFKCVPECQKTYIGETKRILKSRLEEHNQPSRKTAVYLHTSVCEHFQNNLAQTLATKPNAKPREKSQLSQTFLWSHFRAIAYSSNYSKRTTIEALMISLLEPELNEQVRHKKTFLVW